jgi:hypothetical protein
VLRLVRLLAARRRPRRRSSGSDTPCLVERIELTAANADIRTAGLDVLTRMVADHERGDDAAGRPPAPPRRTGRPRLATTKQGVRRAKVARICHGRDQSTVERRPVRAPDLPFSWWPRQDSNLRHTV